MKITFLFICLSVLATISLCQTYTPVQVPSTTKVTDFNPCSQNFYTFTIPLDESVPTSYLDIDIESSSQIYYYLSPTNITFSNIITLPGNNQDTNINVVCQFTEYTQWYLVLSNEGDVQVDYNLTVSVVDVTVTLLQIANTTDVNSNGYDFDSFATSADFYSVTFPQPPKQFSSLEVTITSNDVNNTISSAQINFGNLPDTGCQTLEQGGDTVTLFVDYCALQGNQAGTYYFSVTPENEETLSYSIEITNPAPTVNTLPTGTAGLSGYLLVVDEINFYSVSATEGNVLNFTLTDIVNGELEVNVNYGTLPFFECVNGAPIVSQETTTSCQLIVDYCNSISGVYYIGVQVKTINDPNLPVSYRIFYNQFSAPTAESLAENQYTTGVVSQSFYSHYEFENTDFDVTEDTLLNIRLYVDTYNLQTSYQVNLYVNFDEPAGPNDSCWTSIEECTIVTGGGESSCTIQIDPCLFNDHSNWYASVFASDDLIESRVIQYTIIATLENPVELTQQFEIVSSSVYYDNYDHYYLPESLFTTGYQVDVLITSVSDRVQLYANADGTPAGAIVCPACYNNTDTLSTNDDITYSIVSCPGAEIEDDFYFSIQGQSQGAYSSYSVMYVLSTGLVAPLEDLAPDTLAVGSIGANSAVNYTLGIASFTAENQLTIKLSSQNTSDSLSATLYNSLYLNCLEGTEMYSCTVGATGYCTFTVPSCVFTTADGLILSLSNSDDSNIVYYNVEFSNQEVPTTELENNGIIVSEIGQFQYDLYQYNVQSGASTVVIEVVFFDDGEYNPTGYLNVSTLALGTGPCYPDGDVFNCQSDSKCVFVASSCNLRSETLNIAVYTAYDLYPDLPLKYSIVVRQFSSISSLPAGNPQSTFTGQIYPGQQVYHTFPASVNAALGSQVTFQLSGEVTGVVSQSTPPTADSCPCFEYYPDAVLDPNGNTPDSLTIEYCNQEATSTYTILVEANSDQNPAQQVTYTIVASTFSSTPVPLTLDTVVKGQVIFGYYQYFTVPANVDVVSLSITNIIGGSIGIYYSNDGPATVDCSIGTLACTTPDSACASQLPSCEDITYISVYGDSAESTSPITFNIVISGQNSTDLTVGELSANTTLNASFLSIFSFTLEDTTYTAPIVTFTLTNVLPANGNYRISVFTNDLCSSDLITSTLGDTISIPYCQIEDSDLFFYVTSLETTRTIYFTAEVTVVDVYENNAELELNTPVVLDFTGPWFTYEYAQPALVEGQQSSLTFTITPAVSAYLSFGTHPTSQCSDATFTTTYTISSCCVQEGTYYLAFTTPVLADYTIEVASTLISFTEQVTVNTPTDTITVPLSQTVEFTFAITNLDYQTISVIIDATESVDVSFERISQAGSGLGSCFTDIDTFTSGPGTTVFSIEKCEPYFIGTLYIAVTATTNVTDVTLTVISTDAEDVTTDGTAVPLTATADVTYVYSITVDQADLLPNQELSVEITSNNVTFLADLYASGEYCSDNNAIGSCNDAESCTITYLLCNSVSVYTLSIRAVDDADISISATIVSVAPTPLTAGEATDKPDDSITNLYSFTLADVENSQYVTVTIVYGELTNNFAATWIYNAAAPAGIYCLPTDDSENDCEEYTQDNTANTTTCTFNIEPCELYNGDFLLQIISNAADDQYEVTYTVSDAEPTPITIGETIYNTINENVNHYYQLPFDRSDILPGQSFEIQLDVSCGTADLYINQGLLAGPDCSFSSALTYTLDACDLLESSVTSSPDSDFFITVAGGQTSYPQFDVPTTYSLSSAISGNEIKFVPIGPNQAISYDGTPTIYTYNVAGINDFTGELAFTLSINPEVEGAQATVYISADIPYHPLLPCTNQFQTLTSTQVQTTLFEDSCTVDSVRIFYVSFAVTSSDNSTIMVSRTKQYVRDLNEYNYAQSGAVVGAPVNTEITDEEYYEIEVDPTVAGFRFQATLNTPTTGGWANLLTSLENQPSSCNVFAPDASCSTQNIDGECEVAIDYCEFTNQVLPHIYLTVNTQFDSAIPVPYNLTYTQTVTQTTLTAQQSICGSSNTSWSWYTFPSTATANTFYEFQVYSVSLNEFVDVYLNTEGLATDRCNQYSSTGCTGSCSIVYSCDGFNGQFSLGIEKNTIDTSYFVVVNSIKINPVALTLATAHDSDDDTPVAVGGTEYYFYSFNAPDLNEAAGQSLILTVSSETPVSVSYNTGSPSINCVDDEMFGSNVVFFINSCNYATGTVYVAVSGSPDFTIEVSILAPATVDAIAINSYVEGQLFIDTAEDSFPAFVTYSITFADNDIKAADSFTLNVYGINQGALQIWISEGQVADFSCAVAVFADDTVTLNSCDLTAGTYFVNVLLTTPGQTNPCVPVTFGILLTSNQPATPYNFVTLNTGTTSSSSVFFSNNVYSFTPASPATSLVILTTTSTVPLTVSSSCNVVSSPVQYFFGCSAQPKFTFTVAPSVNSLTPPSTQYNITATTANIQPLSSTPILGTFTQGDYEALLVFQVTVTSEESFEIVIDVITSPSVEIQLWSSECVNGANLLIETFTCYFGTCVLPISQRQGAVANATDSDIYYVTVSGYSPSAFDISVSQGESETCAVPNEDDLKFCTIVDWSTWSYESDTNIIVAQDQTAQRRFDYLYLKFCPPCVCVELSEACNSSLTEYVCTQTFRACDYEGFETSICLTSCQDVEQNCGATFEDIGLPELSCNHNFYLAEDDPICEDIYGTTSSNSELILWIVVGVVLFIVVVVLISVAVVVGYKQVQAKRRASSYEVLE